MTSENFALVSDFFAILMNARWKRREDTFFRPRQGGNQIGMLVGLLNKGGEWDLAGMETVLAENKRSPNEKHECVQSLQPGPLPEPRIWCPIDEIGTAFIVYGTIEGKTADSGFSDDNTAGVKTYREYFRKRWKKEVRGDDPLYVCQRVWKASRSSLSNHCIQQKHNQSCNTDYTLCQNLRKYFLPKELCMEAPHLANPGIALS